MAKRRRKIPQRTCVGCREAAPKRDMVRIVRTPDDGIQIDPTGKLAGRGAYIHEDPACWEAALARNRVAHALKTKLSPEEQEMLTAHLKELSEASKASTSLDNVAQAK